MLRTAPLSSARIRTAGALTAVADAPWLTFANVSGVPAGQRPKRGRTGLRGVPAGLSGWLIGLAYRQDLGTNPGGEITIEARPIESGWRRSGEEEPCHEHEYAQLDTCAQSPDVKRRCAT